MALVNACWLIPHAVTESEGTGSYKWLTFNNPTLAGTVVLN